MLLPYASTVLPKKKKKCLCYFKQLLLGDLLEQQKETNIVLN